MRLCLLLLLISPWSVAETRNPFLPVHPPCQHAWRNWHLRGVVETVAQHATPGKTAHTLRALVQTGDKQWLRVSQGDSLPSGGTVSNLSARTLTLSAGDDCPSITLHLSLKE